MNTFIRFVFVTATLTGCSSLVSPIAEDEENSFQHCQFCPEMRTIPSGEFIMGSPKNEKNRGDDESPQRKVSINYSFAVGVYEITYEQWDECVSQKGCSHMPIARGERRGNYPVSNVSWLDAKQYVQWLSNLTGHDYRLLTEAEWEYVARAGTNTLFWWGDESPKGKAVCAKCDSTGKTDQMSLPVGSYPANPFGLYDVHGNVWEWVEDCWSENYSNHPSNGRAYAPTANCTRRVLRGGSWPNGGRHLRSANRSWKGPNHRSVNGKGFRVALTLN